MEEKKETFRYSYSAKQHEEINDIRRKYLPKEDKMEQIRRLDRSVTRQGMMISLSLGIVSILVLGYGMCCTMVWSDTMFVPGILIGLLGIAGVSVTYPLYVRITRKRREKLAPEILRLTDELTKGE